MLQDITLTTEAEDGAGPSDWSADGAGASDWSVDGAGVSDWSRAGGVSTACAGAWCP